MNFPRCEEAYIEKYATTKGGSHLGQSRDLAAGRCGRRSAVRNPQARNRVENRGHRRTRALFSERHLRITATMTDTGLAIAIGGLRNPGLLVVMIIALIVIERTE